jgi:hypothetical protein
MRLELWCVATRALGGHVDQPADGLRMQAVFQAIEGLLDTPAAVVQLG